MLVIIVTARSETKSHHFTPSSRQSCNEALHDEGFFFFLVSNATEYGLYHFSTYEIKTQKYCEIKNCRTYIFYKAHLHKYRSNKLASYCI